MGAVFVFLHTKHCFGQPDACRCFHGVLQKGSDRLLAVPAFGRIDYVLCYFLSQTVFHGIYLFEWTANHYYLCLWAAPVTFCFLEKYKAALITAIGNWAGILIGQSLGDFIIKVNAARITPDMYVGKVWQLKTHYGVLIWLAVFLLSFIVGIRIEKRTPDGTKNDKNHRMNK